VSHCSVPMGSLSKQAFINVLQRMLVSLSY
jgi:hypothetical protein